MAAASADNGSMPNPLVLIDRRPDHLLVHGTWIDRGHRDEHEPRDIPWSLRLPTQRHVDHLAHVLLHPGVEPAFDPAELEINGVEDARNLVHLNWQHGYHDGLVELASTAAVTIGRIPWEGTLTLSGYTEDGDRLPLAVLTFDEAIEVAERLGRGNLSGIPAGDWVVGAPWFPDADSLREAAEAVLRRVKPAGDPWATAAR